MAQKRKLQSAASKTTKKKKLAKHLEEDEILSDEVNSDAEGIDSDKANGTDYESESDQETAQDKRIRLSKAYLQQIEEKGFDKEEYKDTLNEAIAHRLKEDAQEKSGRDIKLVADKLEPIDWSKNRVLKGHGHTVTCVVISKDSKFLFSASNDCSIIKWLFETGKKMIQIKGYASKKDKQKPGFTKPIGHGAPIYALAISDNFKYLASGCEESLIKLWDPDTMALLHTFQAHKKAVTGLVFHKNTNEFYGCSLDKEVKVWRADTRSFVEQLSGHTEGVLSIDTFNKEIAVTAGGLDQSYKLFKIAHSSYLSFDNNKAFSSDCARCLNDKFFVGGSDNGSLSVYITEKKKPFSTYPHAHGINPENNESNWITSIACFPSSDLIASGSYDGGINIWKLVENTRKLELLQRIPIVGFVNDLRFSPCGKFLVAALSKDHKYGRWFESKKEAKNSVVIYPILFLK